MAFPMLPSLADTTPIPAAATATAATLLRTLLRESTLAVPQAWSIGLNLKSLPAYQQLAGLATAERLALAGQAVAQFKTRTPTKPSSYFDRNLAGELETRLLEHLLNTSADFQATDYVALLFSYLPTEAESSKWNAFALPVELTLRQLSQLLGPAGPTPDVRAALGQLLHEPAFRATHSYELRPVLQQLNKLINKGISRRQQGVFSAVGPGHGQQADPAFSQAGGPAAGSHRAGYGRNSTA
jgi:hypothetical protein